MTSGKWKSIPIYNEGPLLRSLLNNKQPGYKSKRVIDVNGLQHEVAGVEFEEG